MNGRTNRWNAEHIGRGKSIPTPRRLGPGEGVSGGTTSKVIDTNQGRRPNRTVAEQLRLRRGGGKNAGTSGRAECGMTKNEHRVSKSWGATVGAQTGLRRR